MRAVVASKGCGCKGAKCDGSTSGCRNCYRKFKLCNSRRKCKVIVKNPITMVEHVQDVNMMKVMTMLLMMNKLLKHYHLYPVVLIL